MALYTVGPDSILFWDEYDFTGDVREGSLAISTEALDKTAWGDSARTFRAGLHSLQLSAAGHQDHATDGPDERLSAELGTENSIITMAHQGATEGEPAYSLEGCSVAYVPLQGSVGDQATFGIEAQASGNWFRGVVLHRKAERFSTTSATTGEQLGAIAATKNMYAALHVFANGAGTLDVTIQSDDNSGFTTPTTRMTFAQVGSGVTGAWFLGPTAGPGGSDNYWRVSWAATATCTFAVTFCPGTING